MVLRTSQTISAMTLRLFSMSETFRPKDDESRARRQAAPPAFLLGNRPAAPPSPAPAPAPAPEAAADPAAATASEAAATAMLLEASGPSPLLLPQGSLPWPETSGSVPSSSSSSSLSLPMHPPSSTRMRKSATSPHTRSKAVAIPSRPHSASFALCQSSANSSPTSSRFRRNSRESSASTPGPRDIRCLCIVRRMTCSPTWSTSSRTSCA
mmetsp:Transcript_178521/g.572108  ORF Transcript_178521/g.572108 Transcript_178521/m.572108 type:complete len:210 (-) Transcript_178521:1092-1721(-)